MKLYAPFLCILLAGSLLSAHDSQAMGRYDGTTAPSWSFLDRQFADLFFQAQQEIAYQRREGTPHHVYAAFVFCDDGTGTYRYARCWNERSEEEALDTAKRYLATLGSCRGSIKSYTFDQWRKEHAPIPRLADFTPPPKSAREILRDGQLIKQKDEREKLEIKIRNHQSDKAFLRTGKELADWGMRDVLLAKERDELLKRQAAERKKLGID